MRTILKLLPIVLASASFASIAYGEVRLPNVFSDHMVLQRDMPIHIWGWASPDETVTVRFREQSGSTKADSLGNWSIYLSPVHAAGPFDLTVQGTNTVTISDILVGDVWLASGQSNMEMPLNGFNNAVLSHGPEEIANATHPEIRLLRVGKRSSIFPVNDIDARWTLCAPDTAADFSAVAYFFGRAIHEKEKIPIGLIDTTWGGTPAEAWTSLEALGADASLMPVFEARAQMMQDYAEDAEIRARDAREDAAAKAAGQPAPQHPWRPAPESWSPGGLFNGMVAPFVPLGIKGVIWYQGESNSGLLRAPLYHKVSSTLISDWRSQWAEGDFPFLFVQISSFRSTPAENWGLLRDAQRRTLSVTDTAMAVTLDIGNPDNVHPSDKQTVGARLALAARALAYGENIEYSGPLFEQAVPIASGMRVDFSHAKGLVAKGGALEGFEVAGADHRFVPASARIEGDHVIASSSQVGAPVYVRYAWPNAPEANLYNSAGLPASTFTSERE